MTTIVKLFCEYLPSGKAVRVRHIDPLTREPHLHTHEMILTQAKVVHEFSASDLSQLEIIEIDAPAPGAS